MAATTNRRFTELYRNSSIYNSKELAITNFYNHSLINSLKDGEPVLARYRAYFHLDATTKQYVLYNGIQSGATFTRVLSNETSANSTREYKADDYINVTITSGSNTTTKAYKCIASSGTVAPVNTAFTNTSYFSEVTSTPEYIQTVRVLLGVATVIDNGTDTGVPHAKITIYEEDDVIRELVNQANISSPDGTIDIQNVTNGKTIEVNIGSSLKKNTDTSDTTNFGKIDVNLDRQTLIQYPSDYGDASGSTPADPDKQALQNKIHVHHGNTLKESVSSGEEGKLDVRTGKTLTVSDGSDSIDAGTIDVNIDKRTIKQDLSNGKLYVVVDEASGLVVDNTDGIQIKKGEALDFSNTGALDVQYDDNTIGLNGSNQLFVKFNSDNTSPISNTMERKSHDDNGTTVYDGWGVKHGTTISEDTNGIHVNRDNITIKQYPSDYGNASGDTPADPTKQALQNKLYVKHNDTISEDSTNGIGVNFDNVTIYQDPNNKLAVKHDTSLNADASNGISVNIDRVTIKKDGTNNDALTVNHDGTITVDSTDGIGVNIDKKSIKQFTSGADKDKLYVNIDNLTIKEYDSNYETSSLQDKLYVNIDNNTLVSDPSTGIISVNSAATSIFGENPIGIEDHTTGGTVDGKTVRLKISSNDNILTRDDSGLLANITIEDVTNEESSLPVNVLKRYRLLGKNTAPSGQTPVYTQIGDPIDIYKDSSLVDVHIGHVGDQLKDPSQWAEGHTTPVYPEDYIVNATSDDSLSFVYRMADETFSLVSVDIESYLSETEFKDGLQVDPIKHEVSVKPWNGVKIQPITGENGAIEARIGNGIQFGSGTDGQKPFEVRTGNGLEFGTGTEGEKPVGAKIGNGLVFGTGTEGQKPVEVRLGSGLSFDTGTEQSPITDGVRPIKVNIGNGLVMDNNNIKVNLGTGLGFDATAGNEGKIYINYSTIGAVNRSVYWDGTNRTPVQIDYEINKSVPADAVFTDTTYSSGNEITIGTGNVINHDAILGSVFNPTTSGATISGWGASGSIQIPVLSINQYGHVTHASEVTLSVTMPSEPEMKITSYDAPTYPTSHISSDYQEIINDNQIAVDTYYDDAINRLDNKLAGLSDEVANDEAVWSQSIEDEPRYFAKSSSGATELAMTATLVDSRNFAVENNKPINGSKIDVYFSTAHTTSTATLNINNTGSYALIYNDSNFDTTLIEAGTTLALVFDKEYGSNTGCYRVVGGVGSGSGSTNGITHVNSGNGTIVTKNYTEVTINSAGTVYTSDWFENVTPEQNVVYRVTTNGNYYNMAYTWDGTKYVLSTEIQETVAARLGNGLVFGTGTDGQKPIEINLATNMIPEGSTSGSATEINNLGTLLKFTSQGKLAMENTWDCGTY